MESTISKTEINNESNTYDDESIQKLIRENQLLKKQQIKYRNLVNGHIMDKSQLQDEINRLIDENCKLVDQIKEIRKMIN